MRTTQWLMLLALVLRQAAASRPAWGLKFRGGSNDDRYSRQVYTLGARAHGIVRSSTTIVLDSPSASSGLLYETAKNLALLGVAQIVLLDHSDGYDEDGRQLDDLGRAYQRMARAELGDDTTKDGYQLLQAYLQRLNPHVEVTVCTRSEAAVTDDADTSIVVYMAIDQPPKALSYARRIVTVETAGVFGRVQCDGGDDHVVYDASGEPPVAIPLDRLEQHTATTNEAIVYCVPGEQHDVSVGDGVEFQLRNGTVVAPEECTVTAIETPERFRLRVPSSSFVQDMNTHAAIVRRRQIPEPMAFRRLDDLDVDDDALFAPCDLDKSFDRVRRRAAMACWKALRQYGRAPRTRAERDAFLALVNDDDAASHVQRFVRTCAAQLAPLQAVMGAIAAQEAIKAATGLYTPIHQVLLYDCDEILLNDHDGSNEEEDGDELTSTSNQSAPGLRYILGDATVDKLQKQQVFVVGAGAIGCELLKDLAPMGIRKIRVTDMDTIEPSNLSRQLLFRDADVGKFKSLAAKEAAYRLNPDMTVEAYSSKVGGGGEDNPFDEEFWSKRVDVVLNALDNMEARLFIDSQCVANCKPLVDAGTMGPKGNVQVVIPKVSESYASSADPPEPAIPVCTLKNFPYAIAHTIQWGRDLFDGLYRRRPNQANGMVQKLKTKQDIQIVASNLIQESGLDQSLETIEELAEDILAASDMAAARVRTEALVWAARLADELFHQSSVRLLEQHPIDSTDDEEEPFWSGTRRPPKLIQFHDKPGTEEEKTIDENLVQFVRHAAQLRMESILSPADDESSKVISDEDARAALEACQTYPSNRDDKSKSRVVQVLSKCAEIQVSSTLNEIEFEKDDDLHASFCTAASNLRAIAYGIPPVDMAETRRVAGRIIPAMITTTAVVSGLSCIELIKLVQNRPTPQHRNSFLNLALNFYAFTAPLPAPERPGFRGQSYSLWDRWELQESRKAATRGGVRMKSLCRRLQKLTSPDDPDSVDVLSISLGPFTVYSNYMHESDEDFMLSSLWDQLEEATMDDDDDGREDLTTDDIAVDISGPYIDLEVLVEDVKSGEAIELPVVRVKRSRGST